MSEAVSKDFPRIPSASFLLGHLPAMQKDTYGFYLNHHQHYGEYLRFDALPTLSFYSFSAPDALHHILIKSRQHYSRGNRWRRLVGYLGGNGLVTSEGAHWQHQRQLMVPHFGAQELDGYGSVIIQNTLALVDAWKKLPDGTELNISEAMMYLGLINISDILFGYDIRAQAQEFSTGMVKNFAYVDRFIKDPLTPPKFLPSTANRQFKKRMAFADSIAAHMISAARQGHAGHVINTLINAGNSQKNLRDEIITMLMAGHDTTSTALAWGWYLLAQHPDILHNMQDELRAQLKGRPPTQEDFSDLPYTHMVFKEILRLYPSVWAMHRFCEEADEINGFPVKKGCSLALPVYVTHRNPAYWQKPDCFYPEHFSKTVDSNRPRFAYVPFGAGERVCVGARLATMEGVLILATLLQHFEPVLKSTTPVKPMVSFTLKPEQDIIGIKKSTTFNIANNQ